MGLFGNCTAPKSIPRTEQMEPGAVFMKEDYAISHGNQIQCLGIHVPRINSLGKLP